MAKIKENTLVTEILSFSLKNTKYNILLLWDVLFSWAYLDLGLSLVV